MSELTKKGLAVSLKKLLSKKELSKITISNITDECGVNRQTFYYHFKDIYDLLEWIYKNEVIDEIDNKDEDWQQRFLYIFKYVLKKFKLSTALVIAGVVALVGSIANLILNWDNMSKKEKIVSIALASLGASFIALGYAISAGISAATLGIGTIIAAILIFAGVIIVQYKPNDKLVRT